MSWRLAKSLETLRAQVNAAHPKRSKSSDGSIGDERHQASNSDHNPWIADPPGPNVVSAIDITHDPAGGFDSYAFAEVLRANKDTRIKYIISNRKIASSYSTSSSPPWAWRKYSGLNAHDHHIHISVKEDKAHYDSTQPWKLEK